MNIKNFNPKKDHIAREEYGIMAKPMSKKIKPVKVGDILVARIKKEYLGLGGYQRPIKENRIKNIRRSWHKQLGTANVAEISSKGKYYYQIVDGQHRTCASPNDYMDCIVTNTHFPVDNFLMANSPENHKPVSVDEIFWAKMNRVQTIDKTDCDEVKFVYDVFVEHGFTPLPYTEKKNTDDFGTNISKIHNFYKKNIVAKFEKKRANKDFPHKDLNQKDTKVMCQTIFRDVMDIMFGIFGKESFAAKKKYAHAWQGMMNFLSLMDWEYNKKTIISILKTGRWSKFAKGAERDLPLTTIYEWNRAMDEYASLNQRTDQWTQLFIDVYTVSSR